MKEKVSIALGTFDGLHQGHERVLESALQEPTEKKVVITFASPPKLNETKTGLLMTTDEKVVALNNMGFHEVVLLDFNKVKDIPPEFFLTRIFEEYNVGSIVCGFNHRFGKGGRGDTALLKEYCEKYGANLIVCPPVLYEDKPISSSRIREQLALGNIEKANNMLGYSYSLKADIVHGDERGRTIGFPTVNQPVPEEAAVLKFGVYETKTEIGGRVYKSITNFGVRPSYLTEKPYMETHIFDFSGEIYNQSARVYFERFIREEKKFGSVEELKKAIKEDIETVK